MSDQNKEQNIHFMSSADPWETPQDLFDDLNEIFAFELDVCAAEDNAKCENYISKETDSFKVEWNGSCWMNPPYGRKIGRWIEKAKNSAKSGTTVVCLVPARTDTKWFQLIWEAKYIVFLHGRLKFGEAITPAPFPSAVAVFGEEEDLPSDREMTFLSEHGTVVRPVWKYAPVERIRYDVKETVPFIGTVLEYRRARDPMYRQGCPEERGYAKAFQIKELKDGKIKLPEKDKDQGGDLMVDEINGESEG